MVYMLLGTGFEEMEAIAPLDLLRRAGVKVLTVGVAGKQVRGSHGITVEADITLPDQTVPDILYSGNHTAIEKWRRKQSLLLTKKHRPDLFASLPLSKADLKLLKEAESDETPKWEIDALEKGKKFLHR